MAYLKRSARKSYIRRKMASRGQIVRRYKPNLMGILTGRTTVPRIAGATHRFKRYGETIQIYANGSGQLVLPTIAPGATSQCALGNPTISTGPTVGCVDFGMSIQQRLTFVQQHTEFTSLYDRYKILGVAYKIMFQNNSNESVVSTQAPVLSLTFDGDDTAVPTAPFQVQSFGTSKTYMLNGSKVYNYFIKPRLNASVESEVGITATANAISSRAKWLDCNSPAIPHFGIKAWIRDFNNSTSSCQKLTIQPIYYLAMKNSR